MKKIWFNLIFFSLITLSVSIPIPENHPDDTSGWVNGESGCRPHWGAGFRYHPASLRGWGSIAFEISRFPHSELALRRIKTPLSAQAKALQRMLDDDKITAIEDERLLVGGILDELLKINGKYKELYKQKSKVLLIKIYEEVKTGNIFPRGIWKGERRGQGFINASIIIRDLILKEFSPLDKSFLQGVPPEKGWGTWLSERKLSSAKNEFGTNDLIKEALYPEIYDANNPQKPHYFHEWEILDRFDWYSPEGERIIKEAVKHILEDHMKLTLDETFIGKIENWKKWAEENGLGSLKHRFTGREMLKFVYPEKFYPNEGHVWHDWDFHISNWDIEEGDWIAEHFIRHKLFDPVHGEGWPIEGLADRVDSWDSWAKKDTKFYSMVKSKFGSSVLSALKFGLSEEFVRGILKLSDFRFLYGMGVAQLESPLKELLAEKSRVEGTIGYVGYGFGVKYNGYFINKLAEDLGGLWKKENGIYILVNTFPLIDWEGPSTLYVNAQELLRPVPQEYAQFIKIKETLPFPEETAKEILRDEFGIDVRSLNTQELLRLIVALNQWGKDGLRKFLKDTEPFGITVLGNMSDPRIVRDLVGAFDKWMVGFMQYTQIENRIENLSKAFGLEAKRIKDKGINPAEIPNVGKGGPILLEEGVGYAIQKANNQLLELLEENKGNRGKVNALVLAQEKLLFLTQMLEAFRNREMEEMKDKYKKYADGAEEYWFKFRLGSLEKPVRLVLRPQESKDREAGIRFTVSPYSDEEIGFRIDRSWYQFDSQRREKILIVDIDLSKFVSRELFEYHFELAEEHELKLADPEIFSWLVRMVW